MKDSYVDMHKLKVIQRSRSGYEVIPIVTLRTNK